jgi:hypothetical protein
LSPQAATRSDHGPDDQHRGAARGGLEPPYARTSPNTPLPSGHERPDYPAREEVASTSYRRDLHLTPLLSVL